MSTNDLRDQTVTVNVYMLHSASINVQILWYIQRYQLPPHIAYPRRKNQIYIVGLLITTVHQVSITHCTIRNSQLNGNPSNSIQTRRSTVRMRCKDSTNYWLETNLQLRKCNKGSTKRTISQIQTAV
jgi:hypothetical protein